MLNYVIMKERRTNSGKQKPMFELKDRVGTNPGKPKSSWKRVPTVGERMGSM